MEKTCKKCYETKPIQGGFVSATHANCKECVKAARQEKDWNTELNNHLHLIKSFLERNGIGVKTKQLRELEDKVS
ncbi:hypothetical protein [Neobacillus kokaensis]|uniref:Uncharacterized protein n=1 Tax=Neobacillus kokaensis TaxID=2759023 RepID=A0ABQ3MVC4_9BACI|nr:hypothetical protein [Neobacillus kokaensis]GHH96608.1 hypothetical protein AM1BK_01510 [Neobacillus kokaensis]